MTTESVALVRLFVSLGVLAFVWHLWRRVRVDILRQRLFNLRAELFDYAADGHIRFDDEAYRNLRRQFNTLIRFGHRLTAWQLMAPAMVARCLRHDVTAEVDRELSALLAPLPVEARREIARLHREVTLVCLGHVLLVSPVGGMLLCVVDIYRALRRSRRRILHAAKEAPQQGMHARVDRIISLEGRRHGQCTPVAA